MATMKANRKVTEVRPSQLIMNFGPGSIMDTIYGESLMVLGPDYWSGVRWIEEKRLAKTINEQGFGPIERFGIPDIIDVGGFHVAVRTFPVQKVCRDCGLLTSADACPECRSKGLEGKTRPARVVAVCSHGHIQDFPWGRWIGCTCKPGEEKIYVTRKAGSEESDLTVECRKCHHKPRDLTGALEELEWTCDGHRPWLGDAQECKEKLHGVMRGASNVYFTVAESAISIPPYSDKLFKMIRKHFPYAKMYWEDHDNFIQLYIMRQGDLKRLVDTKMFTVEQIVGAFDAYYGSSERGGIKRSEYERLTHCVPYDPKDDFKAREVPYTDKDLKRCFERIVAVETLREVVAIKGFTRLTPYEGPKDDARVQKLRMEAWDTFLTANPVVDEQVEPGLAKDWLPGVERYGEGIFFQFKRDTMERWLAQKEVKERLKDIRSQRRVPYARPGLNTEDPRMVLVHTFAHHFMREVYMSCGYSTTSLRERIYLDDIGPAAMCGVLIYTASMDSEGTLGGLVQQAEEARMVEHITRMIEGARICSQDPLCSTHDPTRTGNAWGASCHSCSQASETSCESMQNRLLDRLCLTGNGTWKGYFE